MLQFPKGYFDNEERSGYMVGEGVKRVWASQMEVLYKLITIFEKYSLKYYIFWGSLLGAVRHQGFIPWDDDLDIAMLGEDYEKFLEIAAEELPQTYHILSPYTSDEVDMHFTRITNGKEIDLVGSWSKEYHGCPIVMGVDIFPLYYIPRDKKMAEEQKQVLTFIRQLRDIMQFRKEHPELNEEEKKEYDLVIAKSLVDVQNMTGYQFVSNRPLERQLDVVFDQISRIATRKESDQVASFDEYIVNNRRIYPIAYFENPVQLPFENIMVTAPGAYDAILKDVYGDYMIPRNYNKMDEHAAVKEQMKHWGRYIEGIFLQNKNDGKAVTIDLDCILKERISYEKASEMIPAEWLQKIYTKDEEGKIHRKTILLYCLSVEKILFYSANVIDKIRNTVQRLKKQADVVIWWLPMWDINKLDGAILEFVPETLAAYGRLVEEFKSQDMGIYDESGGVVRAISMSDAYYGDDGILVPIYTKIGKPVMIQDYLICGE